MGASKSDMDAHVWLSARCARSSRRLARQREEPRSMEARPNFWTSHCCSAAVTALGAPSLLLAHLALSGPGARIVGELLHSVGQLLNVRLLRQVTKLFGCDSRLDIEVRGDVA